MLKVEHVSYRYPNGERDAAGCVLHAGGWAAERHRGPVWKRKNHATVHSGRSGQPVCGGACPLTGRIIKAWTWTGAAGSGSP